jgi:hypothetical protein
MTGKFYAMLDELLDELLEEKQRHPAMIKIALTTMLISLPNHSYTVNRDEYLNLIDNEFRNHRMLFTSAIDNSNFTISLVENVKSDPDEAALAAPTEEER